VSRPDEIRARLEAATPGPWEAHEGPPNVWGVWKHLDTADLPDGGLVDHEIAQKGDDATMADAALIAHAPGDLDYLLGEVERLTQERDAWRSVALTGVDGAMREVIESRFARAMEARP
jgi:hypothetical protein